MRPQLALRISGGLYVGLGLMIWSVLWLVPQVGVPLSTKNPLPHDVITTARGWGDINGAMFAGLGMILIFCSGKKALPSSSSTSSGNKKSGATTNAVNVSVHAQETVMKRVLFANMNLACVLLCFAVFHTVILQHGPPPPVFLAVGSSLCCSFLGWRAEGEEKMTKKHVA